MAISNCLLFGLLVLVGSLISKGPFMLDVVFPPLGRSSFPKGFIFGTASSAYQYEGATKDGGRGPSIWDTFTKYPGKIKDGSSGDVAVDSYHRYKEDVKILKEMGMDAYRFSISWSRVLPNGKLSGGVNEEGIKYYNNLIDELLSNGLQPFVTLFHWDLPQALEDEYSGFLSPLIVEDFQDYAELCYTEFGDRVKHWITLNQPSTFSNGGYYLGNLAPGRCSKLIGNCSVGNSIQEPYFVAHHQLLAHAAAVKVYKEKYQISQKGIIGITLASDWIVPISQAKTDEEAAQRAIDFSLGWFMDPLAYGNYPLTMQDLIGNQLPKFSIEQSGMIKGSFDFIGLNYYTSNYAADNPFCNSTLCTIQTDACVNLTLEKNGIPIGEKSASDWLYVYPRGIQDLLLYTKKRYKNPVIYITENGVDEFNNRTLSLNEALADNMRIDYYRSHLFFAQKAIKRGVDLRGYFAWSLLDNFEWDSGYTVRFGMNYIDFGNNLKRYAKDSAIWFSKFLRR